MTVGGNNSLSSKPSLELKKVLERFSNRSYALMAAQMTDELKMAQDLPGVSYASRHVTLKEVLT